MLRVEPRGRRWMIPGLKKYACELTLDTNTVNTNLKLSNNNRTVTEVKENQLYPDHPDRFDHWPQLLCHDGLTGRCYWEVEWEGGVHIAVTYRGLKRKGRSAESMLGGTSHSWSLYCCDKYYSVWHNNGGTVISSSSVSHRVAVYVDVPAGTLSFYSVSWGSLIHLHTFNTTFTEPCILGSDSGLVLQCLCVQKKIQSMTS
ncbi:stonustoxin subunit beta-like [Stegastes partitus]|uniref:Stonustoxin subunit beta-like n=1 Tax=Stegastes partitus TaxID=144197 RepID=A0A9Y4JUU6_9TELE|nr:PREDICTED: stonustoxin subunit beta-like [Stegastes partitus]